MSAGSVRVATPRATRSARGWRVVAIAAVPVVLVLVWWLVAAMSGSSVIATPAEAAGQIINLMQSPRYQSSLLQTLGTLAISFSCAVVVGGVIGFALGLAPFWMRVSMPIVQALYSIPKVTLFPIFMAAFGFGMIMQSSYAFFQAVFPMIILVMGGTAALRTNEVYLKLGASMGMSFPRLVRVILLPAVAPTFFTAVRTTFGISFLGVILVEMFSGNGGLGDELVRNISLVRMDRILGQVVLIGVYALIPNALLRGLEVWFTRRMAGDARSS